MQAGTSAPGGLVNLSSSGRRRSRAQRRARVRRAAARVGGALDLGDRFGADGAFGWRVNAGHEHLDPQLRNADGERQLLALAGDWRLAPDTLLEAEFETQPPVPAQPARLQPARQPRARRRRIDPRINLNNQPWSRRSCSTATPARCAARSARRANWRFSRARDDAAPEQRRPHRLPVRLQRREDDYRPLLQRRHASTSTTSAARTSAAAATRCDLCARRPRTHWPASTHTLARRRAVHALRSAASSARPSTTSASATSTAALVVPRRPDADRREHQPRRAQHRAVPARRDAR